MSAERAFAALLRLYPSRSRQAFGRGISEAWRGDLDAARRRGAAAVAAFWITAVADAIRYGVAERLAGASARAALTVDWRDACRALRAAPIVTGFSVLSLALGIGGATALFSILDGLVLRPMPVRDAQQLVLLDDDSWTNPIWEALRQRRQAFAEDAFAWSTDRFNVSTTGAADLVEGMWASGRMFETLGVRAVVGRTFTDTDDARGGGASGPVAVISDAFWQHRYAGATDILGRTITIERVPFTIVGVTPRTFRGPDVGRVFDIAIPLGTEPLVRGAASVLDSRLTWWLNIMARLKPGQTAAQATADLRGVQQQVRLVTMPDGPAELRRSYLSDPLTLTTAPAGRSPLRTRYERPLTIILIVSGIVLLIACANVANLLLARASDRRRELTLRLALGASRWRIARQLLAESAVLAGAGAALGVLFAQWGSRAIVTQLSSVASTVDLDLSMDWRVVGFAVAVTTAAALLFGASPAIAVNRIAPGDALKEHGRGGGLDRGGVVRHAAVVLQLALSLALIVAAGLFERTFVALDTKQLAVDRHGVLLVGTDVKRNPANGVGRIALLVRMIDAVRTVPGVAGAAASLTTPAAGFGRNVRVVVPADSPLSPRQRMSWVNQVTPGWFGAMGLSLIAGRDVSTGDGPSAPKVAVVNRAFARRFLQADPVGARFSTEPPFGPPQTYEVVGLVEDTVYRNLRAPMEPTIYLPFAQEGAGASVTIAVRAAAGSPSALVRSVTAAIEREDPTAVVTFRTLDDQIAAALTQERVTATVAMSFALFGLVLSGLGLYGVTSYAVAARRVEMGIRLALGASAPGLVRLVLRRIAWLVGIGVLAGAVLSAWAATFTRSLLYDLERATR